jgi:LacI family transcriptional regulator
MKRDPSPGLTSSGPADARSRRLTIREVADLAGVSTATVSRVLNGRAEVSDRAREAVLRVVRERGYSTNRTARGLTVGRTGLIGVTTPVVHHSYFAVILDGASEALYERDMRMVLCPTHHDHRREASLLERLVRGTTDGALLILPEESADELAALHEHGYPFVIVEPHRYLDERVPTVSAAHSSGASDGVEYLLSLGHRRIAAITGPRGGIPTEERLRGYGAALAAAGVMPDPELVVESDFTAEGGVRAALSLLDLPEPPTAIFAFNDMLAVGVTQAAYTRGVRIPTELSVLGFDDTLEASIVSPPLTTVRQPLAEMGRMAVNLLVDQLQARSKAAPHVQLETKLVVRESTVAPVRSS